ncbi:MAG: hybrid sensor histidine kinase/response regulator [Gammaproteobacteria bacterium]|nr:hybrid sensor histidine kinase/response regulator [Gammaproteobacteria bacterium]MDH5591370.1 hybrid sensor histidine kinase/response regulator [Gammaproteobacteria bacterium]
MKSPESLEILIADDVESIRLYLKEILLPLNVTVTEAVNGDQAFEYIKDHEYDLVLMDIEMPGQSGLEVTRRVREELGYKHTPILIMTGLQQAELIQLAFDNGATDYITKPLSEVEVLSRLSIRLDNRRMERELRNAKILAERSNHAKSEFVSRLAHELKTPLNAISGFSQLIQLDTDNESILESCGLILEAAKHQEDLINEVTNLAKIEAGIIDIDLSAVELSQLIKESFSLTQPMADKFNVRLNFPRRTDVMYTLTADHKRLKQVFLNLLSNAIKYNKPNGEVNLLVKTTPEGHVKVGISDTGKGIAQEDIPKLFEAFNRLGAEESDIEGTGIGLPITRKIIELMGGELEVESTEGEGSIFWVELIGSKHSAD